MKRAVLIGCNYYGTSFEMSGSIEKVQAAKEMYGLRLHVTNFTVLVDAPGTENLPTHDAIETVFDKLVLDSQPGDTVIIHYCGSSTACIVPVDSENVFSDADVRYIIDGFQEGVNVFCVFDAQYVDIVAQLRFTYEDNSTGVPEIAAQSKGRLVPNFDKWKHGRKTHENLSDPETICNVVVLLVETWALSMIFETYHLYGLTLENVLTYSRAALLSNNSSTTPVMETGQLIDIQTTVGKFLKAPL
jgi:hypothetical protein